MRNRYEKRLSQDVRDLQKLVQRLEIQLQDLLEREVARDDRIARIGGRLGGRPRKPVTPHADAQAALEDIPVGDKTALRRFFNQHPPPREQEHVP